MLEIKKSISKSVTAKALVALVQINAILKGLFGGFGEMLLLGHVAASFQQSQQDFLLAFCFLPISTFIQHSYPSLHAFPTSLVGSQFKYLAVMV